MGTIEIKKVERKVIVGKKGEQRQQVQKTYGKIIYRGTLSLADMAEHIMKHGSVYTEDVVIGVITKLKTCMQEMLANGYKVKLDGIGTLYPVLSSKGVENSKDFSANEAVTRLGISFLADQSKKSVYKASAMRQGATLSTQLYSELTGDSHESGTSESGNQGGNQSQSGNENQNQSGNENQGGGGTTNPPSGGGNEND
jgi:predicted histone-like DNA-binding protein